jgi:hypothetical protein
MGAESEWVEAYEHHRMGLKLSLPGRVGLNTFHNAIQMDGTERLRATGRWSLWCSSNIRRCYPEARTALRDHSLVKS